MEKDGTDHVWEDMRPIGEAAIREHFPNILERCEEEGYDPIHEPIPVVPAQHYFMGGITADLSSPHSTAPAVCLRRDLLQRCAWTQSAGQQFTAGIFGLCTARGR